MYMSIEENKATILRWTAAVERNDHEGVAAEMHPDARWKIHGDTPVGGERDMDSVYNEVMPALFSHFVEPIKFKLVGITAEGDRVAAEFTGQAPLDNGLTLDNVYHLLFKFQDGKIIHGTEYYDTKHLYDVIFGEKAQALRAEKGI
jgi:ketosteroid isomerase-like protein